MIPRTAMALTENERRTLARMIEAGEEIPSVWRAKLFPEAQHSVEIGKEYRLEYAGKMKREQVLAETPAAPWLLVRSFDDDWKNLLVWGDNLLALRGVEATLYRHRPENLPRHQPLRRRGLRQSHPLPQEPRPHGEEHSGIPRLRSSGTVAHRSCPQCNSP